MRFLTGACKCLSTRLDPILQAAPASEAPSDASLLRCPNAVHGSSIVWRHISGEISFLRCWVFFLPMICSTWVESVSSESGRSPHKPAGLLPVLKY